MKNKLNNQRGFGLIEILISATIVSIAFISFIVFILFARNSTYQAKRSTEALSSTEGALEVVRKLRDQSWTTNIVPLSTGTIYYPKIVSGNWTLTTANPTPGSYYTTTVVLSPVNRDGSFNIVTLGTLDSNTKKVVVTTSWTDSGSKNVKLTTYITNYKGN